MNKKLIILGVLSVLLWSFVSWMTFGIPSSIVRSIDSLTFHLFSDYTTNLLSGFYYDTNNHDMPTVVFLFIFIIIFGLYLLGIRSVENDQPRKNSLLIIVIFSIVFRVIMLPSIPIHENDIYRYLWDGKSITQGINPFKFAPADLFMYEQNIKEDYYSEENDLWIRAKDFSDEDKKKLNRLIDLRDENYVYYYRIGYKEVPTVYPPTAQFVFAISSFIATDSIMFMKFIFLLFDGAVIWLVILLLKHFNKNPCFSIVYAWSPLVLKEFANSGHYDPIAIFFTLLAVYLYMREKNKGAMVSLSLATLSKFYSGILLPLLRRTFKWGYVMFFGCVSVILYAPFFLVQNVGSGIFEGLSTYNKEWAYNGSVYAIIYNMLYAVSPEYFLSHYPAKTLSGLLILGVIFWLWRKSEVNDWGILHQCFVATAALFILNPVGDPWYFCWMIPYLCFFRYRSWIILSGLLMFSYINFQQGYTLTQMEWLGIDVVSWVIYVPFFVILALEARNRKNAIT